MRWQLFSYSNLKGASLTSTTFIDQKSLELFLHEASKLVVCKGKFLLKLVFERVFLRMVYARVGGLFEQENWKFKNFEEFNFFPTKIGFDSISKAFKWLGCFILTN